MKTISLCIIFIIFATDLHVSMVTAASHSEQKAPQGKCIHHRLKAQERVKNGDVRVYIPFCDNEGNFRPLQHHDRMFFCVDTKTGRVVTRKSPVSRDCQEISEPQGKCHMQRLKAQERMENGHVHVYIPLCDAEGNFQALQHHEEMFFCVDTKTGRMVTRKSPVSLDCKGEPMGRCQIHWLEAQERIKNGERDVFVPRCDDQGNYEPRQRDRGGVFCADAITGEMLSRGNPNCHRQLCYEDRRRAEEKIQDGVENVYIPKCDEQGNFEPQQQRGNEHFCVDTMTGEIMSETSDSPVTCD